MADCPALSENDGGVDNLSGLNDEQLRTPLTLLRELLYAPSHSTGTSSGRGNYPSRGPTEWNRWMKDAADIRTEYVRIMRAAFAPRDGPSNGGREAASRGSP